jgi:hypothetical protein
MVSPDHDLVTLLREALASVADPTKAGAIICRVGAGERCDEDLLSGLSRRAALQHLGQP